jgi:hypothetical protein
VFGYRARLKVLGYSFSHGEQEKSGSMDERRKREAAAEGDFWVGLGHSVEAIYRPYCAKETTHIQGHIQQQQ